ncbi:Severe Depolymerization of Actin [Tieghemiomyces parasiticus]|uniref:Protein SDA1 n=1 Tax=Tieghemiomyces parasiticus TaxID=78921 RepID=A0A9W8AG94_9FUNG|nr:Severe Depolymerization of Actin [Tieghemiomyces parasiticus]
MVRRQRAALLPNNLPQLQNLIKRDPLSYKEEFLQQWKHFESSLDLLRLKPEEEAKHFGELVMFLAQVCHCYRTECASFPDRIIDVLQTHYGVLHTDVRRTLVQCLILLRNKDVIPSNKTLTLFFTLFRCHDKVLRERLYEHIVSDIRTANAKSVNNRLNKELQNFMYGMIMKIENHPGQAIAVSATTKVSGGGDSSVAAKRSLDVCIELYRKNVWNDSKTVNIVAEACFSSSAKIMATAVRFFLGSDDPNHATPESDDEAGPKPDIQKMQHSAQVNKKRKSKARAYDKALNSLRKRDSKSHTVESSNFSAIHLLNDPQGFAEKLYSRLNRSGNYKHTTVERFEVRLMVMKLISRVIGTHQLMLLPFYQYLVKYLKPTQIDVTQVMALLAQACHPLLPPDEIEPVIMAIANQFVTDNCSPEVMAAGMNTIRAVCARCPLAMTGDLLVDLTEFRGHRDKGVSMAARSLITLFREVNPELLKRKDRGKAATQRLIAGQHVTLKYGETNVQTSIDGADLLRAAEAGGDGENDDDAAWEVASAAGSDDSDGWVNMQHSDREDELSAAGSDDDGDIVLSGDEVEWEVASDAGSGMLTDGDEADGDKTTEASIPMEMTKILTPQDFVRINELRLQREAERAVEGTVRPKPVPAKRMVNGKLKAMPETQSLTQTKAPADLERVVDESEIIGRFRKKLKSTYEERLASIEAGREDRAKYKSSKGRQTEGASTTNEKKKRNKAYSMFIHKKEGLMKRRISLKDKQRQLRAHITKQKRRGK